MGFLSDTQIQHALNNGALIDRGTWDISMLRHASYTLRLGDRVEVCPAAEAAQRETRQFGVIRLDSKNPTLELRPGDCALLYSLEYLRLTAAMIGFTVARGLLFAESLAPENTYVDPGFTGPLYTTVTNISNRIVRLTYGMPIARLFFYELSEPVQDAYRSGAANGIAQQLESVRATTVSTIEESKTAKEDELLSQIQLIAFGGNQLHELFKRENLKAKRLFVLSILWPILLLIANTNIWVKSNIGLLVSNVLASVLAGVIMIYGPVLYKQWIGK